MQLTVHSTNYKKDGIKQNTKELKFEINVEAENELINIYTDVEYQKFTGFGGALTDSAGYVYAQMNEDDRKTLINSYFKKDQMGYSRVRIPVDSCDFSVEQFEAVSDKEDIDFSSFSLNREKKYIYPLWEDVAKACADVEVMVTPWSPPAFMKSNGIRIQGGHLLPEYRAAYAEYLCKYIKELGKIGIHVKQMSIQNEPKAVQTWDSCIMDAQEEKVFLRDYLYPALQENGITDVDLFIWDHNKERVYERACAIIDETTAHMVKGIAFHWYSGDHFEALSMVREKFPHFQLILSEACIEYSKFGAESDLLNVKKYIHEIIGNLNAGMTAFYDWNIVLDKVGGPNHVGNFCDAPYLYHEDEKRLEERATLSAIGHFSKYIKPGAVRIAHSKYTEEIDVTVFKNVDKSLAVVLFNPTEKEIPVTLRIGDECACVTLEGLSAVTAIVEQ